MGPTLPEVAPGASELVPTVGQTPALAVLVFKRTSAALAAAAATAIASTTVIVTCSLSTRLLITLGDLDIICNPRWSGLYASRVGSEEGTLTCERCCMP